MDSTGELEQALKKYNLDELLILFSNISINLYLGNKFFEQVPVKVYENGLIRDHVHNVTAWDLAELSFEAIKSTKDNQGIPPRIEDYFFLDNLQKIVSNDKAKKELAKVKDKDKSFTILFGLSQKEFWYQHLLHSKVWLYNYLRYYILLGEIPACFPNKIQPNNDLLEIVGLNIKDISSIIFFLQGCFMCTKTGLFNPVVSPDVTEKMPVLTTENVRKVISYFSANYEQLKKLGDKVNNNPLFIKPIIITDKGNRYILSNIFIWLRKFYEGIYWIIRDKYKGTDSLQFTNDFGEYYEKYTTMVLEYYLPSTQYKKIEEDKALRADWIITTSKYVIIVEQKSSLMILSLKKEYPSNEGIIQYLEKYQEAYEQINQTIIDLFSQEKRTIVKLVLHLEDIYFPRKIEEKMEEICRENISNLDNYYFINTEEFESLMQVLNESEVDFDKIIASKISHNAPSEDPTFSGHIRKIHPINSIRFLEQYTNMFKDLWKDAK